MCVVLLWRVTYPSKKKMENGLILIGDLPRKNGLIVIVAGARRRSDRPPKKNK